MTAPYIIRDQLGYWHSFDLPVAHVNPPVGVLLIVYLQPGEKLECNTLLNALKPALTPAPLGQWYRITVEVRYIRKRPNQSADIVTWANLNDLIQVTDEIIAPPGVWGKVIAARIGNQPKSILGYAYLGNLEKVNL